MGAAEREADTDKKRTYSTKILKTPSPEAPAPEGPDDRFYLIVFEQDSSRMVVLPRNGELILGRAEDAEVRVDDRHVSRRHAKLTMSGGQARLVDLGSQNGTHVGGERIAGERVLLSGDTITICSTTLIFHSRAREHASRTILDFAMLRQRLEEEVERARRYHRPLALVAVTLGVKNVDRPRMTTLLEGRMRLLDILGWGGGDGLLALLPETDQAGASEAATRLLEAVSPLAPEARAGVAVTPDDGLDVPTLLASAREAAVSAGGARKIGAAAEAFKTLDIGERKAVVADPAMVRLYSLIERLAASDLPVLVGGETGTGKELAASALHHWSRRKGGPLVVINCAALPENLVESELFGHQKGAFSGATSAKEGMLEVADGGTVFLDEVGELPAAAQAKLLRVLETKRVTRLGDVREREIDLRVVAATNRDLAAEVKAGRFRQDLYFRLSGATLWIPPLRDRTRELPILAHAFLAAACAQVARAPMTLSSDAVAALLGHEWPGNLRELKNLMDYLAATVTDPVVETWHVAERLSPTGEPQPRAVEATPPPDRPAGAAATDPPRFRPIDEEVEELERARMTAALAATSGNRTQAAALIAMPLRTFVAKLKKYGINAPSGRPAR